MARHHASGEIVGHSDLAAIDMRNNAGNDPMVAVNEQLGYKLSRTYDTYVRKYSGRLSPEYKKIA